MALGVRLVRSSRIPAARTGALHGQGASAKKPGPCGPGLKFASVGAPANHLPEGKKLPTSDCQSGRITVNRRSDSRTALCKAIPRRTTWWPACQPCAANTVVHTSYVTIAIAWCGIATGKSAMHDVRSMIAKSNHDFGKDHAPTTFARADNTGRAGNRDANSSSAARWRPESREMPARARRS
jgi:hypothetical protein